jgi:hypothetical protein
MIFSKFDPTDIVAGRIQPVSTGIWSDGEPDWSVFFTSSQQTVVSASAFEPLNGLYYTDVYDAPTSSIDSDIYFSVAYGNYYGSGSSNFDEDTTQGSLLFPTQIIYNQYRNLLLTPGDQFFSFAYNNNVGGLQSVTSSTDIYVINFKGSKVKDQLDPGQFEITLSGDGNSITLIDDSQVNPNTGIQTGGQYYNLIKGSLASGSGAVFEYNGFGSVYPSLGLVVLNPSAINGAIGTISGIAAVPVQLNDPDPSNWGGDFARMPNLLFKAISDGAAINSMKARVTEYVPAKHFFVRVKNQEYNYSNNPSFVITSEDSPINAQDIGKIRFADFYTDPKVYVTSVGLYDSNNNLVAVAKLSQPTLKDFTNELLIRVRLDF